MSKFRMGNIVKTKHKYSDGIYTQYIFGLNLLGVNKVGADWPRQAFVRLVGETLTPSVHTGSLHDLANSPEELFKFTDKYDKVSVGLFGGAFYDANEWNLFSPCYFPSGKILLSIGLIGYPSDFIRDAICQGALALYRNPIASDHPDQMKTLFAQPFVSNQEWIRQVLQIFQLIMTTSADGEYFNVYSTAEEHFRVLDSAITQINSSVIGTEWYKKNKDTLKWDDERNMCLKLVS